MTSPVTTPRPDEMPEDGEEDDNSTLGTPDIEERPDIDERRMIELPEKPLAVIHVKEPELLFWAWPNLRSPKRWVISLRTTLCTESYKRNFGWRDWNTAGPSLLAAMGYTARRICRGATARPKGKENSDYTSRIFRGWKKRFGITFNPGDFVQRQIDLKVLDEATRTLNQHEAVRKAVDLYRAAD